MRARRRGRFTVSWEGCRRGTWGLTVTQDTPKVFDAWPFLRTFAKDAPRATSDSCNSGATVARTHGLYAAAAAGPGEGWRVARGDDAWESDPTPPRVVCVKDRTQSMGRGPPYIYIAPGGRFAKTLVPNGLLYAPPYAPYIYIYIYI